ncbi:proline racemase family protein [Geminicoccaceae bacterium 1502E]|nr:proline racemase family protein [Geminicoccaceae bacterium 1502E]
MRWTRSMTLLGVHAEGEIGKVLTGGVLPGEVPGGTMLAKLRHLNEVDDSLRRFCVLAPRGTPEASVNLLLPPCEAEAHAGFIVMQPDQCHAMSGSNAICVATALLETGMVPMTEPETELVLDTAAGLVRARATCRDGRCEKVSLAMPASFAEALDVAVDVPGLGQVRLDIAFGGVFYALVDPAPLGLSIGPASARRLVEAGMTILAAARAQIVPEHPERPGLRGLAYLMWCGLDGEGSRNATVMPPGRLDRSPCGTGSSARLAVLHARGQAAADTRQVFRSAIGTRFEALIEGVTRVAGRPAILPRIAGRGFMFSREEIGLDPADPFPLGHALSDSWGPGAAEL